jgi:hypothetical protein
MRRSEIYLDMSAALVGIVDRCGHCGKVLHCTARDTHYLKLGSLSDGPREWQDAITNEIQVYQHEDDSDAILQCQDMACSTSPSIRRAYLGRISQYMMKDIYKDNTDVAGRVNFSTATWGQQDAKFEIVAYITADSAAAVNLPNSGWLFGRLRARDASPTSIR